MVGHNTIFVPHSETNKTRTATRRGSVKLANVICELGLDT